jgi:hypothetical protein
MNSDNYEFAKSSHPQSTSAYSPYSDKQWNYLNDIQGGIYQNSLTSVQFDLSSIANSEKLTDVSDLFLTIPLVMVATCSTALAALVAPPTGAYSLCSLKSNYQNLIHQIELTANGKSIHDVQSFTNVYTNFKLLSSLSATDLKGICPSMNINECLDNEKSVVWQSVPGGAASKPGVGLCNNLPFAINNSSPGPYTKVQNTGNYNYAINNRISRIVDTTTGTYNGIYGSGATTIMSATQIATEFKPYFVVENNVMTWFDVGIIPLKYVLDSVNNMGLVKKMDLQLKMFLNTGAIQISTTNAGVATCQYNAVAGSTFQATCPLTINYINATQANGGLQTTTALITAGLYVARAPNTFGQTAITISGSSQLSHPMPACRCYYSQVKLDPQRQAEYITLNRSKLVVYERFLYNQYNSISAGGNFSQLVQSGIKNPIGVAIIPFISSLTNLNSAGAIGLTQYGSPYDTSPATYSPVSLTSVQVALGGVNMLQNVLNYSFENFLEQVSLAETLTSTDIGVATGLINQNFWEQNRVYWVDLARARPADRAIPRNLVVSFTNNSKVIIDVLIFTVFADEFTLDVETGVVVKGGQ